MKICSKCKAEKPLTEFSQCLSAKDGRQPKCKDCERAYRKENAEKRSDYNREYCKKNPGKIADRHRKYRKENPEKIAEYQREYRKANAEKVVAWASAWYKANPENAAAKCRTRRALKCAAEGAHTAADIRIIFTAQRGMCANCKVKLIKSGKQKYHVDHIMPLALGGSNWPSNLQCLCAPCNLSKSAKHPDVWAKQQGKLL